MEKNEMNRNLELVLEWQTLFGAGGRHVVSETPIRIDRTLADIRVDFINEELEEYLDANHDGDLVEVLDALCDLTYFVNGMIVIHGLQDVFDEAFQIVHDSNMSKAGADGKPILREDGKILKGPGYRTPTQLLTELLDKRRTGANNGL